MNISRRMDLSALFLANTTIHLGRTYILPTILTELTKEFSLSLIRLGGIISLILAVEAITLPISGYISDRRGRSLSIPVSLLIYGLLLVIIGIFGRKSLSVFVVGLTIIGVIAGFYHTAAISLILDIFNEESRGKAQSVHSTGAFIGSAIGPTLMGIIFLVKRPWSDVYLVLSIPVLVISIILFLKRVGIEIDQSRIDLNREIPSGPLSLLSLKSEPPVVLKALILLTTIRTIGTVQNEMISFILPTFLTEQGHSQATAAFLFSVVAISGIIGILLGGYFADRIGPLRFLILAYAFQGVTATFLVVTSGTNLIILTCFVFGVVKSTTFPAVLCLIARYSPMYRRGMAYAMTSVLPTTSKSIAPTIDGFFAENQSITQIFVLGIAFAFANVALMPLLSREEKKNRFIPKIRNSTRENLS